MAKNLIERIKHEFGGLKFYQRNIAATKSMGQIPMTMYQDFLITGLPKDRIKEMDALHQRFRDGRQVNFWRRSLLRRKGQSICGIVTNQAGEMVGFEFFYFREGEVKQGIIHGGFIGVVPEHRGKGIATALRQHMLAHFSNQGLKGISIKIKNDNIPSMKSALKVGFQPLNEESEEGEELTLYYYTENFSS